MYSHVKPSLLVSSACNTHGLNTNMQVGFAEARGEKQVSLQGAKGGKEGRGRQQNE